MALSPPHVGTLLDRWTVASTHVNDNPQGLPAWPQSPLPLQDAHQSPEGPTQEGRPACPIQFQPLSPGM